MYQKLTKNEIIRRDEKILKILLPESVEKKKKLTLKQIFISSIKKVKKKVAKKLK